jgi:hypothetical protein
VNCTLRAAARPAPPATWKTFETNHRCKEPTMTTTHDWTIDLKKYVPDFDAAAVTGIVNHLGIALREKSKDASYVACHDKTERDLVRDHFLKKKLGLTAPDAELDQAVMAVCERMKAERDKPRVTFYYLLAQKYGKLDAFHHH